MDINMFSALNNITKIVILLYNAVLTYSEYGVILKLLFAWQHISQNVLF